jgi:hypothetical protein
MLLLNATTCVYSGAQPDGSDFNQLVVQLPNVGYNLDKSNDCKTAVQVSDTHDK